VLAVIMLRHEGAGNDDEQAPDERADAEPSARAQFGSMPIGQQLEAADC
jgi:hypothetical protein